MSHKQLDSIMRDTDHELGDQVFNDTEWQSLCKEKGADPSKGLSRSDFLSLYFDGAAHPASSIKSDFMRIFAEGGTPPPSKNTHTNVPQKSGQQIDWVPLTAEKLDSLSTEDAKMFAAIWAKYANGEFMSHEKLNSIMRDTDHELEEQLLNGSTQWITAFNDADWVSLCKEKGADPSKGLSKSV